MRDFAERHALALVLALAVAGLAATALAAAITDASAGDISAYGLFVVAVVAVVLALWRSLSTQRQAAASGRQAETTHREALDARLRHGAEMVNSEHAGVRAAGRHLLTSLAKEHPTEYSALVAQILEAAKIEDDHGRADDLG